MKDGYRVFDSDIYVLEPADQCDMSPIRHQFHKLSKEPELETWKKIGSPGWARTSDILINSQALYQLSYRGVACDSASDRAGNSG
jgi:hypothetical protein